MLALLISGLLLALFGALYMYVLGSYPGYLLLRVGDFALEINLWFLLSALLIAAVLGYFTLRFVRKLLRSVFGSVSWLQSRSSAKAERRAASGLKQYFAGQWQAAKKELLLAAKASANPLHYLAAADSASHLGQYEEQQALLAQAEKYADPDDPSVSVIRIRALLNSHKSAEAQALLNAIPAAQAQQPAILELRYRLALQNQNWASARDLLPKLKTAKIYPPEMFENIEVEFWLALFNHSARKLGTTSETLRQVWLSVPKALRKHSRLIATYASALQQVGKDEEAHTLVKTALKTDWHDELLTVYSKLKISNTQAQLSSAEAWLSTHPGDAHLYYVLGKLSARNELWGKARDYFEKSLSLKKSPETYAALGDLLAKLGQAEKSCQIYREGLREMNALMDRTEKSAQIFF